MLFKKIFNPDIKIIVNYSYRDRPDLRYPIKNSSTIITGSRAQINNENIIKLIKLKHEFIEEITNMKKI